MTRGSAALLFLLALTSCRTYDYSPHVSDAGGLVPGDQLSRYGSEQAQAVAVSRRFAELDQGESPAQLAAQADSAVAFARKQPDVINAIADPQSHRITLEFKSGWRVGVVPLAE
jgi:hypothetical protein